MWSLLPGSRWTSGSPNDAGSAFDTSGVFTVTGEGSDIWNTSDQFHYVYRALGGDGMIIARVATQQATDPWAKAGVMIRNSVAGGDQSVLMAVTPGNGTTMQYRATSGASAVQTSDTTGFAAPYWVKLVRAGNTFTGYRSPNGVAWTLQGSTTVAMDSAVLIGLAVCSHNSGALNTSTFDKVSILDAADQTLTVNSGAAGTVNLLANAVGPTGATLTVTSVTQGAKGAVVNNGDGTATYTSAANAIGIDSFAYTISDGLGDTASATVNVAINGLLAYYQFNEGTGTTSADATGDGFTATLQGATWTTGIEGTGGLGFNGSSGYRPFRH